MPDFSISRPLEDAKLRVVSLGAGVQSTTLVIMAARGDIGPMPDAAIFADTESEPAAVYAHLEWLKPQLPFPVYTVTAGSLFRELIDASNGVRNAHARPPLFVRNARTGAVGFTRRQCTQDYKIEPIRKKVRELIGLKPRQRSPKVKLVEQWIGISTDELQRVKDSRDAFIQNRHPLIEMGMSRRDCLRYMEERQLPQPPKSACTFCPFHSNAMWRDIRDNDPASWAQALEVDAALERGIGGLKNRGYLHRTCKPLSEVDLRTGVERGQPDMFGFDNECDGVCGV